MVVPRANRNAIVVLPWFFDRNPFSQSREIITPDAAINADFAKIGAASFIAFEDRFYDIIGSDPIIEKFFDLPEINHEAPNYLPRQNKVFVSGFNETHDCLINLDTEPPTIKNSRVHHFSQ
ncbi:hypothetical protein K432DRAFT_409715 [Lepidopterella palustris CBS 459.81]|uniref:Uncharacterized protein n=1 Tax=Lepidopterella palustris CBS 459.81 TaxID=1314670 RepID=A0A8E2DZG8_9PEZI|nr:hypothetical protein K432DRAFT_409715 [Lepidopterella palustris CBS 459.81]